MLRPGRKKTLHSQAVAAQRWREFKFDPPRLQKENWFGVLMMYPLAIRLTTHLTYWQRLLDSFEKTTRHFQASRRSQDWGYWSIVLLTSPTTMRRPRFHTDLMQVYGQKFQTLYLYCPSYRNIGRWSDILSLRQYLRRVFGRHHLSIGAKPTLWRGNRIWW